MSLPFLEIFSKDDSMFLALGAVPLSKDDSMFLALGAVPPSEDDAELLGGDDNSHVWAMIKKMDWIKPLKGGSSSIHINQSGIYNGSMCKLGVEPG